MRIRAVEEAITNTSLGSELSGAICKGLVTLTCISQAYVVVVDVLYSIVVIVVVVVITVIVVVVIVE